MTSRFSTPELIRRIAIRMGRRPKLIPIPVTLLKLAGLLTGKVAEVRRLCGSLTAGHFTAARNASWTGRRRSSLDAGLARTVRCLSSTGRNARGG